MKLALYQPEIPGNVGAMLRLAACLSVSVDIIEPCGFVWSDTRIRRAGMDYIDHVAIVRHANWDAFKGEAGRIVLLTTKAETRLTDFTFDADDTLLMGQESAGVPQLVRDSCEAAVRIPLMPLVRSLNVSMAAGMALFEALRQTGTLPR